MRCPNCKKEIGEGKKFCPACGTKIESGIKEYPQGGGKKKSGARWPIFVILGVLLLGAAGAAAWFLFLADRQEESRDDGDEEIEIEETYEDGEAESDDRSEKENAAEEETEGDMETAAAVLTEAAAEPSTEAETEAGINYETGPVPYRIDFSSAVGLSPRDRIPVTRDMTAESSQVVQQGYDNSGYMAFDGNYETSWQDGVDGDGLGENIQVFFGETRQIHAISFGLGNHRKESLYWENNVPESLIMNIDGVDYELTFPHLMDETALVFDRPVKANVIRFTVRSVYKGTKYDDTCIADISFYESAAE